MLLDKLAGRSFTTEVPIEFFKETPVAPRIVHLKDVHLGLVTTAGLVPLGNPDKLKPWHNTRWGKYSIEKLDSMKEASWDVIHVGYHTGLMYEDPNYGVPLDVCRELEREGAFARLYPNFYSTPGCSGGVLDMEAIGMEIARDMKANGVNAVLLVSTWGTCSRSGAVISREIEKEGIPVAFVTAMVLMGIHTKASRIIGGVAIPHPCGDPSLLPEADHALRRGIVELALKALQTDVAEPTIFALDVASSVG